MSFSYKPLWIQLIQKDMKKTELMKKIQCSPRTLAVMGKNEYVALSVLDRICQILDCNIEDVIEYVKDEKNEN